MTLEIEAIPVDLDRAGKPVASSHLDAPAASRKRCGPSLTNTVVPSTSRVVAFGGTLGENLRHASIFDADFRQARVVHAAMAPAFIDVEIRSSPRAERFVKMPGELGAATIFRHQPATSAAAGVATQSAMTIPMILTRSGYDAARVRTEVRAPGCVPPRN